MSSFSGVTLFYCILLHFRLLLLSPKPRPFVQSFFVLRSSILCMRPDNHNTHFFLFSFFWKCRFFRVFCTITVLCLYGETQCVLCVCFLPIHSGHQVRWTYQPGHTGGRSHRIYHPPSFCGACLDPFGTIGLTTASFFLLDSPVLVALFCMGQPP